MTSNSEKGKKRVGENFQSGTWQPTTRQFYFNSNLISLILLSYTFLQIQQLLYAKREEKDKITKYTVFTKKVFNYKPSTAEKHYALFPNTVCKYLCAFIAVQFWFVKRKVDDCLYKICYKSASANDCPAITLSLGKSYGQSLPSCNNIALCFHVQDLRALLLHALRSYWEKEKKKSAKTNGIFLQKLNSGLTKRHDVSVLCRNEEFIRKTVNNGSH